MLEGPIALACLSFQRRRIVEAFERCDLASDDAIKIGTDRARGSLIEAVTDLAQSDAGFALFRVGLGQSRKDLSPWRCLATLRGAFRRLRSLCLRRLFCRGAPPAR